MLKKIKFLLKLYDFRVYLKNFLYICSDGRKKKYKKMQNFSLFLVVFENSKVFIYRTKKK